MATLRVQLGVEQSLHFERETKFRAKTFPGETAFVFKKQG
jgi:hypothetical protein